MKCSFSRLLYPKRLEEARDGSYMIALFRPNEKILDAQGNRLNSIKVVGHFLPTVASVKVDMTGHWKKDARYGLQFEMESYEAIVGSDKSSVVAYLSSGMIPGIGSVLAERIYNTFGEQTLEVLDQDPTRVAEVPGINKKKCDQFCTAYMETRSARKLINMLASFNISAPQAIKLRQQLGTEAQALLTQFPYMVFERDLIDFETADQLAQANGIPKNAPERLDAGLLYTLKLAEHDGHLCMHKEAFVRRAVNLLHAPLVTWKGVSVSVTAAKDCFVATARVYPSYTNPADQYLAEATASRGYMADKPTVSPREWAQTAAIGIALRNAGFGLQFNAAGDSFDSPAVDELGGIIWSGEDESQVPQATGAPVETVAQAAPQTPPEPEDPLEKAMNTPCPISKYSGRTLGQVLREDPHAILWVANKFRGDPEISAAAKLICEQSMEQSA